MKVITRQKYSKGENFTKALQIKTLMSTQITVAE